MPDQGDSNGSNGKKHKLFNIFVAIGLPAALIGLVISLITNGATKNEIKLFRHIEYPIVHIFGVRSHSASFNPPVKIQSVTVQRLFPIQGDTYIFPQPLSISASALSQLNQMMKSIQGSDAMDTWARAHGGVDPSWVHIQVVATGNRNYTVRIIGMDVQGECTTPLRGTIMYAPPQGSDSSNFIGFNLDSRGDPHARFYSPTGRGFGADYFLFRTISFKPAEPSQTFEIVAVSFKRFCQFTIVLKVVDGNKIVSETISDNGHPFKVSGTLPLARYQEVYTGAICHLSSKDFWIRADPKNAGC